MIDISEMLGRLCDSPIAWSDEAAVEIADSLARSFGAVVDWDDEAGEEWLSVLIRDARVAIVSTGLQLVFAVEGLSVDLEIPAREGKVIFVPSFDDPVIRCDIAVLGQAFGGEEKFRTLDTENFSANDLWFATV
ncbi:hypothetical protein [Streptomyces odonnellii]|uniref:hypothetical protein n=1 Tax=Streptomyces odonnellii TaxID=1417980 RepID=UPI000625E536|nr:hypothetical protein [Streptomyces odonnellii]